MPEWVRRDLEEAAHVASGLPSTVEDPLDDVLYRDWYLRRPELEAAAPDPPPMLTMNLVGALQASHHGDRQWLPGWTVERVSNRGRVAVGRNGQQRLLDRIDVVPDEPARAALPLRPGDGVSVSVRVDGISPDGGFWVTFGEGWEHPPSGTCVRFYWDVGCRDAPALVGLLTRRLAAAALPYLLKLPLDCAGYCRADAAVLYVAGSMVDAATPVLRGVHAAVAGTLRSPTPRLAYRLAPGLATAEDPPTGESFGQHRCRLVAEAARASGRSTVVDRILERLSAEGIDPSRPYANPGSSRFLAPWT